MMLSELMFIRPELIVLVTAVLILLLDARIFKTWKAPLTLITLFMLSLAAITLARYPDLGSIPVFRGTYLFSSFTVTFKLMLIGITMLILLTSNQFFALRREFCGIYISCILFSVLGMMAAVSSLTLVGLWLSFELMAVPLYRLTLYPWHPCLSASGGSAEARPAGTAALPGSDNARQAEAGHKHLILGWFATAIMLFGISLMYLATGSFFLDDLANLPVSGLYRIGVILLVVSILFRAAIAPFHFWSPDVLDGSISPVAAFISVGMTATGLAVLIPFRTDWLLVCAILTIFLGALSAINQNNSKRLLTFIAISHGGFLLLSALTCVETLLFNLAGFSAAMIGGFTVISILENSEDEDFARSLGGFRGLLYRKPLLSLAMTVYLLSLAGLPLTAGFINRFVIIQSCLKSNLFFVAGFAAAGSVLLAYCCLRLVVIMCFQRVSADDTSIYPFITLSGYIVLFTCLLIIVYLGMFPHHVITPRF